MIDNDVHVNVISTYILNVHRYLVLTLCYVQVKVKD